MSDKAEENSKQEEENPAIKSSDDFDKEMEEFFTMRAMERSQTIPTEDGDSSSGDTYQIEKKWDAKESAMSGCCMTGCHNCPWGYKLPSENQ